MWLPVDGRFDLTDPSRATGVVEGLGVGVGVDRELRLIGVGDKTARPPEEGPAYSFAHVRWVNPHSPQLPWLHVGSHLCEPDDAYADLRHAHRAKREGLCFDLEIRAPGLQLLGGVAPVRFGGKRELVELLEITEGAGAKVHLSPELP